MVQVCVTWDVLLVLLNPSQDFTSFRAGARPGHPIAGLVHPSKRHLYLITSSARASNVAGTSRPSARAVLRLMTSSYLVGACTGRSDWLSHRDSGTCAIGCGFVSCYMS